MKASPFHCQYCHVRTCQWEEDWPSIGSSPLLREEIEVLLRKRAVERVQNPGTPGFYSRIFLVPKKERKVTANYRFFFSKPIHKERIFPYGDSQVSKMLRARRNEKEMKVKPATSFKLLTIFIHKKMNQDSKQNNVSKQYLSSLCHKVP